MKPERYRVYNVPADADAHYRWAVIDVTADKIVTLHNRQRDAALDAEALNAIDARRRSAA